MKRLRIFLARVRGLLTQRRAGAELDEELETHLALLAERFTAQGMEPAEAAAAARRQFGNRTLLRERHREARGLVLFVALWRDVRYGARLLRKSPGFTAVAVISLALAIGVNTTIFSLARQLLYERLDVPHAEDLRLLAWTGTENHTAVHHIYGDSNDLPGGLLASSVFSYPAYEQLRAEQRVLDDLIAFKDGGANATIRDVAQRAQVEMVSGNYYSQLQVRAQLGRTILPSDDTVPGQGAVAVISDGLWEREFGHSPAVLGQWIKINDIPLMIVGVNPRGFTGAHGTLQSPDVFLPISMQPSIMPPEHGEARLIDPNQWWVNVMGRAKPGVSEAQAQAELNTQLAAIVRATMPVRPGEDLPHLEVRDGSKGLFEQEQVYAQPITVLLTLVGLVLLLACANIANLMLARGAQRQREMSVRMALGAGRARIVRQMLVESLMLAALGGAGGLAAGYFGSNAIPKLLENAWERSDLQVHFNWMVFAFTAGVTLLTGVLFGLAPALAAARAEGTHGLKETTQTTTRRRKGMSSKALVGFQIALSTLLVVGAGLFIRTLAALSAMNVGFRTDHLLIAAINPPQTRYPAGQDIVLHQRLEQAFAAIPGVESVATSVIAYINDDSDSTDFLPQGQSFDRNQSQEENYNVVGNRIFETMGIPILAGRGFGPQDTASSTKVAVINASLARKRFPGQNPIGKWFSTGTHNSDGHASTTGDDLIQIVGVCGDTRYASLRDAPPAQFFLPYVQQTHVGGMVYLLRTRIEPEAIVPELRRAAQAIDLDLPLVDVRTEDEQIDADTQQERLFVVLTAGFGLLALALAAVGIYGIMAYSVASRRNEIGIRMALGAQPGQVRGMILRESWWLAAAGIAVGMAGALGLTRMVQSMLYGIRADDPATLAAGVGLLLAVALAAAWIPARRAARVQPMEALRCE